MLLTGARIVTMDEQEFASGYIRIRGAKIESVGDMANAPSPEADETVLDVSGKLILPGFIDAHSHIGLVEDGLGAEGDDINEDSEPVTPHLRALDGINPFDTAFESARKCGVTSVVVSPGSANPIAGQICALKTSGRWVDKMAIRQPLAIKFSLGENPKMTYGVKAQFPVTRMGTAAVIREALYKAQRYMADIDRANDEEEGSDPPEYDAKCEALLPLLRGEIAAHFHTHKAYDILTALRICDEFSLRCTLIHCTEGYLIADILKEHAVPAVCGPVICSRSKPELAGMTLENSRKLIEAGVPVAISSDHPEVPVEFLPMSAAIAAANGLSSQSALRCLTIEAARAVGISDRVGSITAGKDADLLVFDGDPLAVGAKPELVLINGEQVV